MNGKILIGSDHGGYELKQEICKYLAQNGYEYEDVGSHSEEIVRYPYFAGEVAARVSENLSLRGILICSTGIGMSIVANRYPGVRAALCTTPYMAQMTREHNDSNILCLGGKVIDGPQAVELVDIWLNGRYIGGRHAISLGLIKELDEAVETGQVWKPTPPE